MNKFLNLILSLLLISISLFSQTVSQWRGMNRDGIYNESNLLKKWPDEGPKMLWHFDELGKGFSSPVIAKDKIYITGSVAGKDFLFALDITGKKLWRTEYGATWDESYPGTRTTPTLDNNKLYVHSTYGMAVCIDAATGKILWSVDVVKTFKGKVPRWGIAESPLVYGDKVFFSAGGSAANVVALNKNDGKTIWVSKGKGDKSAYCSPYIIDHKGKKILITITADNILGIDPESGKLLWSYKKTNTWSVHPNTPTYKDGMLYCVSGYGSGGVMLKIADDGNSVTQVWKNETLDNQIGGVVLWDGFIYGSGQNDPEWQCLDWKTGEVKFKSKALAKGCIISADNMLYAYGEKGELALVKPGITDFNIVSKIKIELGLEQHWAHPVINNGVLYVRHGNVLMAYSISAK
ncbi:MAG: PQQ-like beta-propeller repeat protein [Bacteroidia bacterium]|nr:PQQ-like beta-propeller repeat protein [Bacteroidia bacterium]